ncbi:ABC transporter substrate-binding protein [Luteimonas sp. RD2P54]|uniref:ABC transporter substrate-binding protein n=1 Tax=Luteimonas endophytica TaxID=3042023 RepID=A0ABT6J563_9GAMM|nr:ABC transporter substrate-binding protein [Luteimonas endophytica]MDH5821692.1 ABC transporter substrate-binding protein [Luteimonas endophytica]
MRKLAGLAGLPLLGALALAGCGPAPTAGQDAGALPEGGTQLPLRHARHADIHRFPGYTVVRVSGPVPDGGEGTVPRRDTVVLVPRGAPLPQLPAALAGAQVIRTPVRTIATNSGADEAFLGQLGIADRLVAVGGLGSYDRAIRTRTLAGEIGQVGYNWHAPPNLDVLVRQVPDVFLMRMGSLEHAAALERARRLGIPVLPTFAEDEPHYLGRAEWLRVYGLLAGRQAQADALFGRIEARVAALRRAASALPPTPVLWAYPAGADRWVATVRGAEGRLLADAGGRNLLARPGQAGAHASEMVSTEAVLPAADTAAVWILGDIHAAPPRSLALLQGLGAWRGGRLYGNTARIDPQANAYDWYQTGVVRPDWVLQDFVKALHPGLVDAPFVFLRPLRPGEFR